VNENWFLLSVKMQHIIRWPEQPYAVVVTQVLGFAGVKVGGKAPECLNGKPCQMAS
jgi:hypothetical protein